MKNKNYRPLGLTVALTVAESVDEFDRLAGKVGACLEEAVDNIVYRGGMADFRDTFLHGDASKNIIGVEEETGIEREFETRELKSKNADGSANTTDVWTESEAVYFNRVKATLVKNGTYPSVEAVLAHFQDLANQVAASITFDPAAAEPKTRAPRKASKENLAIAQKYIDLGKADKFAALLTSKLGHPVLATLEALAAGVAEDLRNQEAKMRQSLLDVDLS